MNGFLDMEVNLNLFLQSLGDWLTLPFQGISMLAAEYFFIFIIPLVYWCIDALMGLRMAFLLVISNSINSFFKMLFHSPRPFWYDAKVQALSQETSFGLPSGHSQNSASIYGVTTHHVKKKGFTFLILAVIFLVGLSRIYLGMHFLRDVLTGWFLGALCVAGYLWAEKRLSGWINKRRLGTQILLSLLFASAVILAGLAGKTTSAHWMMPAVWIETAAATGGAVPDPFNIEGSITLAGVAFGFTAGYACWVKKFGVPVVKGSVLKRFTRFFVGIVGVVVIYLGLKMVFPEEPMLIGFVLRFVRYTILSLWVSYFGPYLFKKLKLEA